MSATPLIVDEAACLTGLGSGAVLDCERDSAFDDVAILAGRLSNCPIAFITLYESGQCCVKSCVGIDVDDLSQDLSFCDIVHSGDGLVVIADATEDSRTCAKTHMVGMPNVRFFAGLPLRLDNGETLGAICVMDTEVREETASLRSDLEMLGRQAVRLIQSRIEASMLDDLVQRLALAVEGTNDGVWDWMDIDADAEWWSPKFYRLLGYEPNEIESTVTNFKNLLHPNDRERTNRAVDAAFKGTVVFDLRFQLRHKTGDYRWFQSRARVFRDASGRPTRMAGSIRDVQNLVDAENAAKMREKELRLILDVVPSLVYFKDCNNKILNLNQAAASAMKCDVADVIGRPTEAFFPAEDAAAFLLDDREVLESGEPKLGIVEHHEGANGQRLLIRTDKLPIQNEDGEFDRLVAISTDITAITEAQRKLTESENMLKAILDNAPAVMFAKRVDGRYLFVNCEYAKLFTNGSTQIEGKTDFELFPTDLAERFRNADKLVTRMKKPMQFEEIAPVGGELRQYLSVKFPMLDSSGEVTAVGGVAFDITDLKRANGELERKNVELESFVYSASHDLKSPIVSILGYLFLLSRDLDAGKLDEMPEFFSRIKRAAERMRSSVDDLLELSRIGRVDGEIERIELRPVIDETIQQEVSVAGREDIRWEFDLEAKVIAIDPTHLSHILQNLIGNAIRYGTKEPNGKVIIGSRSLPGNRTQLFVRDFGAGVAPAHRNKIFELFQRLERDKKGTGVGLAIVRKIAELYGGSATVEGAVGGGAKFVVEIGLPQRSRSNGVEVQDRDENAK